MTRGRSFRSLPLPRLRPRVGWRAALRFRLRAALGFRLRAEPGGFILYVLILLVICGFGLVLALSRFKSGAIEQLGKTMDQNRLTGLAQAGMSEILARVKSEVNNPATEFGNLFREIFSDPATKGPGNLGVNWTRERKFDATDLPMANEIAKNSLGSDLKIDGSIRIVAHEKIQTPFPSFSGYIEMIAQASTSRGGKQAVRIKERREVKFLDVRDFFDKYVLYVKSYCGALNNPDRRLITEGILPRDSAYSRIFLGNRFYPKCPEFPDGENSPTPPPILLDIDFEDDKALIAQLVSGETKFGSINQGVADASNGNVFWVQNPPIAFSSVSSPYSIEDFFQVPELKDVYMGVVNKAQPYSNDPNSVAFEVIKDYNQTGGDPAQSYFFRAMVKTCIDSWKYHFGYTDFSHLVQEQQKPTQFAQVDAFCGVLKYFIENAENGYNYQRCIGGKMPLLFGESRDRGAFVEGPVYLRFFKIAFFDEFTKDMSFAGGSFRVFIPVIPLSFLRYEKPKTFLNKDVGKLFGVGIEKWLMSRAVDSKPVNSLFFPQRKKALEVPQQVGTALKGDQIFPSVDTNLRTVSHVYPSGKAFLEDRVVDEGGKPVLDLDGLMFISAQDGAPLNLTGVNAFRGRGLIILLKGHCIIGTLERLQKGSNDSLRIYLPEGSFFLGGSESVVKIEASLQATVFRPHGATLSPNDQGRIVMNGKGAQILGNLVVDSLNELDTLPKGKSLRIVHDEKLYFPPDPVRISIGKVRSFFAVSMEGDR